MLDVEVETVVYEGNNAVLGCIARSQRAERMTQELVVLDAPAHLTSLIGMELWGGDARILVGKRRAPLFIRVSERELRLIPPPPPILLPEEETELAYPS